MKGRIGRREGEDWKEGRKDWKEGRRGLEGGKERITSREGKH